MKILDEQEIRENYNEDIALEFIRIGFQAFSAGKVQLPSPQQFWFNQADGDCCIKSAWTEGSEYFCIKVSTGFYKNTLHGLPSNDGLNLVFSAMTGQPIALLNDRGWLTGIRTALAGRIVAELLLPSPIKCISIFGTGLQAELQLRQLLSLTPCRSVIIWGRTEQALSLFKDKVKDIDICLETTTCAERAACNASFIVTATASSSPLIRAEWIQPGTHISAVGADRPGKQELDPAILLAADCILVDSISQCSSYGELSHLTANLRYEKNVMEIGALLADPGLYKRSHSDITVADLTGLGVQDLQISASILHSCNL